jgi:hypothetical protein
MSFLRSFFILFFASLLLSLGLLALGSKNIDNEYRGGYAVLATDASVDDRALRELLDAGKNDFAFSAVTESSQWVMLDDFGSLEVVPLDKYSSRLSSFDPRNDGYAGKLKDIFIHDDKRFAYIPLEAGNWDPAAMDRHFNGLLGDIPFSVNYFGVEKSVSLFFLIFAASSLVVLIIVFVKRNTHPGAASIIAVLPVLSPLAFFGAPGIACAAVLLGFAVMLREPLNELVALYRLPSNTKGQKLKLIYKNVIEPYGLCWLSLPVFAAAVGTIVYYSQLKLFFVLLVCAAALFVFFLSVRTLSLLGGKHRRFTPVLIIRRQFVNFAFSVYMLPLTAAAVAAIILTPRISGGYVSDTKFDHIIDEGDYYAHLNYQASFSLRQLGGPGADYPGYLFDEDGLPSPDKSAGPIPFVNIDEYPPFPLKHLMEFFVSVNTSEIVEGDVNSENVPRYLPVFVLLLLIIPGFFINEKIKSSSEGNFAGLERISGKQRRDIRRQTLMYKNKNTLHSREESSSPGVWWRFQKDA